MSEKVDNVITTEVNLVNKDICYFCGRKGHKAAQCIHKKRYIERLEKQNKSSTNMEAKFKANGQSSYKTTKFPANKSNRTENNRNLKDYRKVRQNQEEMMDINQVEFDKEEHGEIVDVGVLDTHDIISTKKCFDKCTAVKQNKIDINMVKSYSKNTNLISTLVWMNGKQAEAVFDTGAAQTVISLEKVNKLGLKFEATKQVVRVADGNVIKPIGITESVLICVHEVACFLKMIILPIKHISVLLGLDWFEQTGASIEPVTKSLRFKSKSINLELENELYDNTVEEIEISAIEDLEDMNEAIEFKKNENLTIEENAKLIELLSQWEQIFATDIKHLKKPCTVTKFKTNTITEKPIYILPWRTPISQREIIDNEIKEMLQYGIIRESNSPWSSPIIIVKKKDGKPRFCIDYRKLNAITISDPFPIPKIETILERISQKGTKWFSTIDLKSGYWQVAMDEDSIQKTAFSTESNHYEFCRLPFGLNKPLQLFLE